MVQRLTRICTCRLWLLPAMLCLSAGCSKLVSVEGTVTYDGKPLERGSVTFMPVTYGSPPADGPVINGVFRMTTRNKTGTISGKYKIVISSTKNGKEMLPPSYSSSQQTILTYEVPPKGSKELLFDLTSKGTPPSYMASGG